MKTKNTKGLATDISPQQFEEAMARYAEAEQREKEINNNIEEEVNEVLQRYEEELTTLSQGKSMAFEVVHEYCVQNKSALFSRRRSIGTVYGIAGFRLGTPRLKTMRGSNWNHVLAALKEKLPQYVRANEEPAKDLLLADRNKEHVAPLLEEIGIQVVQDELFYIETKKAA